MKICLNYANFWKKFPELIEFSQLSKVLIKKVSKITIIAVTDDFTLEGAMKWKIISRFSGHKEYYLHC